MITFWRILLIVLLAAYGMSCASAFLPTRVFLFSNIFSIAFPYLFVSSVFATLLHFLFFRSKWYLIVLVFLLGGYNLSHLYASGNKNFFLQKNDRALRILTWNTASFSPPGAYISIVDTYVPDVICIQEYIPTREAESLLKEKGYLYNATAIDSSIIDGAQHSMAFGVAIFSKHPVDSIQRTPFSKDDHIRQMLSANLSFNHKVVRVHTFHLLSYQISQSKEALADEHNLRYTIRRLVRVSENQEKQIITYNKAISAGTLPNIVCGDFNNVPTSYIYNKAKKNKHDAFLEGARGFGVTFPNFLRSLRIDYILTDKRLKVTQAKIIETSVSDHYPVVADIAL